MANYDLTYEGSRVQGILDTGDELRDAGYIFRGEATPSTVPGTPTERVAYIGGPGTYTNFGSSTVVPSGSIGIFKYTGSAWSNEVIACTVPISTTVQNNDTTVPTGKAVKTVTDAISGAVSSEASARQLGDSTLQGGINTVSAAITAINNAIGNGSVYAGIATPSSTPASGKVFYLAFTAGTYTNFNSLEVPQGINILKNNGSTWLLDSFLGIDDAPIQGSDNLVKSGGVLNSIIQNGPAFDLSAYNAQGGTLATYADLSAALTALNALPADFKKGGMSMKYVQTSDNKYVQFRCMADEFTTDVTQWAIAEEGVYVENPKFVYVKTDAEDKILWAIKTDGSIYYGAGVPQQVIDYINERIAELSLDEYENIVAFLDGLEEGEYTLLQLLNTKVNKEIGESLINKDYADGLSYTETQKEFIAVWLDSNDKIVFGLNYDGNFYFGYGVPKQIVEYVNSVKDELLTVVATKVDKEAGKSLTPIRYIQETQSSNWIQADIDDEDKLIRGIKKDGTTYFYRLESPSLDELDERKVEKEAGKGLSTNDYANNDKEVVNAYYFEEDAEHRSEIKTDADNKIISYRDKDGVLHEEVGIETDTVKTGHLLLSNEGITEFSQALKESGFKTGCGDWSDETSLHIPEPQCALINFTGINNIPQAKGVDMHGYMEFYDMQGNYFKKEVIMNAQGNSSMIYPKKNVAVDICNNNGWDDEDTFKLQIGSWVVQDSYHLKAYYTDPFRGTGAIGYKIYNSIVKSRGVLDDYVWKKALVNMSSITPTSNGASTTAETKSQYTNGARCFPDGFPCIVYLNGTFYGIYSMQLKKHRDNYMMDKSTLTHIHLDGEIGNTTLFNGEIDWTKFEVRNPKNLIDMDGNKYDGDNPTELIDSTSPNYDSTNNKHVNTATVKQYIQNTADMKTAITNAYATYNESPKAAEDVAALKAVFETYLDVDNIIDYTIFSDIAKNDDGFYKNWQWFTYDGVKWFIGAYDLDCTFGNTPEATQDFWAPATSHLRPTMWFLQILYDVYEDEVEARYAELRNAKIIDVDAIVSVAENWLNRLGNKTTFDKEWQTWPNYIKNDSIFRLYKWVKKSIENMDRVYNYNN